MQTYTSYLYFTLYQPAGTEGVCVNTGRGCSTPYAPCLVLVTYTLGTITHRALDEDALILYTHTLGSTHRALDEDELILILIL